jgi:guanosine-3',5'-bis(diphosphate) 3'-pyrophosphohydrolase
MDFSEQDFSLLLSAVKFAADRHRGQRRKDADASPYINHPIAVAETLWNVGHVRDINTIVAAILHDTLEDTDATAEEIAGLFGQEILSVVQEVTDDKSLPKAERKRLQIVNAPHKSVAAKQIKLADKMNNIRDITNAPPADWPARRKLEYLDWAQQVSAGLRGANSGLEAEFDAALHRAREKFASEAADEGAAD